MIDHATNADGDTNRLKMLNVWERDIDDAVPPVVYESHGPSLAVVMTELRTTFPHPHGLKARYTAQRYCACCDEWREYGAVGCSECGAPWERVA